MNISKNGNQTPSVRCVTPLGAWALSLGCAVGWGAFMMPGNTFLPVAGPLGTVLGFVIGTLIMLVVAVNYVGLMQRCPDGGGVFSYVKCSFDADHGFVAAWFLLLTYVAIVWANTTALPLIGRFLLGSVFQYGGHYRIAGYDIYTGELLLALAALAFFGLMCTRTRVALTVQIVMALLLCGGVLVSAYAVFSRLDGGFSSIVPAFSPARSPLAGIFTVVAMGPWAFVGFESISHATGEFTFPVKRALPIMALALLTGAAAYCTLTVIGATCLPAGFENWTEYIAALDTLDVSEAAPVFHAVRTAMGPVGTPVLVFTVLGGVITGLLGNTFAASRLLCAMAEDGMMPAAAAKRNRFGAPANAVIMILAVSAVIPFFGRTAVGWIVDVTTVGAAVVYAYASACAFRLGRCEKKSLLTATGLLGVAISLMFLLYSLVPNLLAVSALSHESYLILALWSVAGLVVFRFLLVNDETRQLGRSTIVWIVLLSLTLFTSLVWMRQSAFSTTHEAMGSIHAYYDQILETNGVDIPEEVHRQMDTILESQLDGVSSSFTKNSLVQIFFVVVAVITLVNIFSIIHKREKQIEREKILAEESSRAKTSFLSNMSHEIRTPMNAIIGLDNIALKDPDLAPRTREQLEKIGASAKHLLGLINDILDMSRIESGRMVLKEEEFFFRDFLDQINVMVNGQCVDKGLHYDCHIIGQVADYYIGDAMKLKQVLINILGNAVKFTPAGGSVTFTVEQTARFEEHCTLRFRMKDTGIGMSKEFLPRIFEAFSQENSGAANRYGSTGLGMAITKNLVEMMNGHIEVDSEKGKGTTFTVTVTLKASKTRARGEFCILPAGIKALIVDDDTVALEHARLVLADIGIRAETVSSSADALARARAAWEEGDPYTLLLTDERMPGLDGLALTRALREFDGGRTAVIILTGYNWDDILADADATGVDAIMSKPVFSDSLLREIQGILLRRGSIADTEEHETAEESAGEEVSLEGLRVLMAEDIELNAEILTDLLDLEGITAERAVNGQRAVEMFSQHEAGYYDAILMDVRMPVLDGLGATAAIRALEREDAKTIPIIAMTANAYDEDVQRSLQAGMNAHLSKPIEPDRLYSTLRAIAARRG